MNILHLNEHSLVKGGAEAYMLDSIQRLEARGHDCQLAYAKDTPNIKVKSVKLSSIGQVVAPDLKQDIERLKQFVEKQRTDLIHIHGTWNIEILRTCVNLRPCIITSHDYRWLCPDSKFYWKRSQCICQRTPGWACIPTSIKHKCLTLRPNLMIRNIQRINQFNEFFPQIKAVIAPSQYAAHRINQTSYPSEKTHIIPYYCSFAPLEIPRKIPTQKSISIIGRTADYKGIEYFISALGKLPKDICGYIMGDVEGQKADRIMNIATVEGCRDRLKLQSWSNKDGVVKLLEKTSILVFPSIWPETLGIIGLEAMAYGIPVIGSNIGGVPDWLEHGRTGYLSNPKSAEDIASFGLKIFNNPKLMTSMGVAGQKSIRNKFSPDRHLQRLEHVYASCI